MDGLQARPIATSSSKARAVEDARLIQVSVIDNARRIGKDPPKYVLLELIGKGSYGRVYKGKDMITAEIVAVKIIDIDESDTVSPRNADSYSEFLKEISTLKILSANKARNINHVIDALPVGQTTWMITQYCGGGSVATLMKPTAPGGLLEKWVIPILREVAEAIKWVHDAGVIHRDIKCANILVTELGGVQLCDFGVAGTLETKLDKRSTFIGTLHWMAPELFDPNPSYGKEVDIWAFGCMVYEIATGLPPCVDTGVPYERIGSHSKTSVLRLEGGNYSNDLRHLVAYCLEELPHSRPTIDQVQKHSYIWSSSSRYPTSSLAHLVRAFKMWDDHVGSRESLFMLGGTDGPAKDSFTSIAHDEWTFSTTAAFDKEVYEGSPAQDVYDAYGTTTELQDFLSEEDSRPRFQKSSRRRPPPHVLVRLPAPLEKIFDPKTLSNYDDNSRSHYGRPLQQPSTYSPLRDGTPQTSTKDTMIDLGAHDFVTGLSTFSDMETIKAYRRDSRERADGKHNSTVHESSRPTLSDSEEININRRTQDWKFPAMALPAAASSEISCVPAVPYPTMTADSGGLPALIRHPTEPIGAAYTDQILNTQKASLDRDSIGISLIDLDMSLPDAIAPYAHMSTVKSDTDSTNGEQTVFSNSFELEKHASLYAMPSPRNNGKISNFSVSNTGLSVSSTSVALTDVDKQSPPPFSTQVLFTRRANDHCIFSRFPELPSPPSEKALSGLATQEELKEELNRMLGSMNSQLQTFRDLYTSLQSLQINRQMTHTALKQKE